MKIIEGKFNKAKIFTDVVEEMALKQEKSREKAIAKIIFEAIAFFTHKLINRI